MDDIPWSDWQVVHAAWTHGSFTAAAAALGVGQATVSRRVAHVEAALGHALFDRHRTGLVPTAAALRLRPHLEGLATAALGAARAADGLEVEARGEVTLAGAPGLCHDFAPRLAVRLARTHPDIQLCVLADIEARDLDRREADIALRMVPTTQGDLLVRRLVDLPGGLFATAAYRDTLPPEPSWSDIALVRYSDDFAHIELERFLRSLGARTAFRSNDYLVQRAAVRAGLGAALLGDLEAEWLGLVPVDIALPVAAVASLHLVVHRALRHVPRVAVVIDAIDAVLEEISPGGSPPAGSGAGAPR